MINEKGQIILGISQSLTRPGGNALDSSIGFGRARVLCGADFLQWDDQPQRDASWATRLLSYLRINKGELNESVCDSWNRKLLLV